MLRVCGIVLFVIYFMCFNVVMLLLSYIFFNIFLKVVKLRNLVNDDCFRENKNRVELIDYLFKFFFVGG